MARELIVALEQIRGARLLVLGDVMLDCYVQGNTERVSPEAPVLVLDAGDREVRLGGAASVAAMARALDCRVDLAGGVGEDHNGEMVQRLMDEAGIGDNFLFHDATRPTTTKQRFIGKAAGRHPHQVLRVDQESRAPLSGELEEKATANFCAKLPEYDAILISDYAKGFCTPALLSALIRVARERAIPVIIDPARITDFARYQGATVLTPNRAEAELALSESLSDVHRALAAAKQLRDRCNADTVLITLDRDGMALASQSCHKHLPTIPRDVYDNTGAGDMVLAAIGAGQAASVGMLAGARLANLAAGMEVGEFGAVPICRERIQADLAHGERSALQRITTITELNQLVLDYRQAGKSIVFTNGCFDLLHAGHTTYLQQAASLGDVLIVAVNSDTSVARLKGAGRPIMGEDSRVAVLNALRWVDHVVVFDEGTPLELLQRIRPDVLVKGGTYSVEEIVGREFVESYGGTVCVTERVEGMSSSTLISKMQDLTQANTIR